MDSNHAAGAYLRQLVTQYIGDTSPLVREVTDLDFEWFIRNEDGFFAVCGWVYFTHVERDGEFKADFLGYGSLTPIANERLAVRMGAFEYGADNAPYQRLVDDLLSQGIVLTDNRFHALDPD